MLSVFSLSVAAAAATTVALLSAAYPFRYSLFLRDVDPQQFHNFMKGTRAIVLHLFRLAHCVSIAAAAAAAAAATTINPLLMNPIYYFNSSFRKARKSIKRNQILSGPWYLTATPREILDFFFIYFYILFVPPSEKALHFLLFESALQYSVTQYATSLPPTHTRTLPMWLLFEKIRCVRWCNVTPVRFSPTLKKVKNRKFRWPLAARTVDGSFDRGILPGRTNKIKIKKKAGVVPTMHSQKTVIINRRKCLRLNLGNIFLLTRVTTTAERRGENCQIVCERTFEWCNVNNCQL